MHEPDASARGSVPELGENFSEILFTVRTKRYAEESQCTIVTLTKIYGLLWHFREPYGIKYVTETYGSQGIFETDRRFV